MGVFGPTKTFYWLNNNEHAQWMIIILPQPSI